MILESRLSSRAGLAVSPQMILESRKNSRAGSAVSLRIILDSSCSLAGLAAVRPADDILEKLAPLDLAAPILCS
jgi:hypothetical protein